MIVFSYSKLFAFESTCTRTVSYIALPMGHWRFVPVARECSDGRGQDTAHTIVLSYQATITSLCLMHSFLPHTTAQPLLDPAMQVPLLHIARAAPPPPFPTGASHSHRVRNATVLVRSTRAAPHALFVTPTPTPPSPTALKKARSATDTLAACHPRKTRRERSRSFYAQGVRPCTIYTSTPTELSSFHRPL